MWSVGVRPSWGPVVRGYGACGDGRGGRGGGGGGGGGGVAGGGVCFKEVVRNRRARFNYEVERVLEAGIELKGTEVKSVRAGKVSMQDGFCRVMRDFEGSRRPQVILLNCTIAAHGTTASFFNHEPDRKRRLLLSRKEIDKLYEEQERGGKSIIPTRMYLKGSNVKVEIGVGSGKSAGDKRETIKKREAERTIRRVIKNIR